MKPTSGERMNESPMYFACAQLTPSPKTWPGAIREFARPTPKMAPISEWELEAGRPRYHVPRFQMMAERRSAKTMAKPAPEPMLITSSTGRRLTIP